MKKRLLAGLVSLAMLLGLAPSPALADDTGAGQVTQTATNLTKNQDGDYVSDVTMTLPSGAYSRSVDVVFVLDGSTSSDASTLAAAAADMLEDLAENPCLDLQAGLVIFGGTVPVLDSVDLTDMSDAEKLAELVTKLTNKGYDTMTGRSGSNLQAGIEKARALLQAGGAENKYMVVLTDGGARMWVNDAGESVAQVPYANNWNTTEDFIARYINGTLPLRTFEEIVADANGGKEIGAFAVNEAGSKDSGNIVANLTNGAVNVKTSPDYYTNLESATYFAAQSLGEIKESGEANVIWVDYPYNKGTKYGDYTESFKSWLADNGYVTRYDSDSTSDPFAQVKKDLVYYVDEGSKVTNTIGYGTDNYGNAYDFAMVDLDAMTLKFGADGLSAAKIADNHYGFGAQDQAGRYPFELIYYPDGGDYFELKINTAVTLETPVQLVYQVKLTNPQTVAGSYGTYDEDGSEGLSSLRVSSQATLYPVDSTGTAGQALPFPLPTVSYEVIPASAETVTVNVMPMTVYAGGQGYEGVVTDNQGDVAGVTENTLPEPGYTIDLPADVDAALKAALNVPAGEAVDLSGHLQFTYNDGKETRLWTVERYDRNEGNNSQVEGRYLYRLVSAEDQPAVRLVFKDEQGNLTLSDDFQIDQEHPNQTYTMSIYAGALDQSQVKAEIRLSDTASPYSYDIAVNAAELKIRGVVSDAEDPTTEIQPGVEPETPVETQTAQVPENTKYYYKTSGNESSGIQVADAGAVGLLVDEVLPSATAALEATAVDAFDQLPESYNIEMCYLDLVYTKNSNAVVAADQPVTVYWPYPEGTDRNTEFFIVHYKGLDRNEEEALTDDYTMELYAAGAEAPGYELENTPLGIRFTVDSFSPFALIWESDAPVVAPTTPPQEETAATPPPAPAAVPVAAQPAATATAAIPQTGDSARPLLWVTLTALSGAALAVLAVRRKKRTDQ